MSSTHGTSTDQFVFDEAWFSGDGTEANNALALTSMQLSAASAFDGKYAEEMLEAMGFSDIIFTYRENDDNSLFSSINASDMYNMHKEQTVFAHKKLKDGTELLAVLPRSYGYDTVWANNLTVGKSGDHDGFLTSSKYISACLNIYLNAKYSDNIPDNLKLWASGYSRSASIVNLFGAHLAEYLENVNLVGRYIYTFSPIYTTDNTAANGSEFNYIHNYVSDADPVTKIGTTGLNYRYGETIAFQDLEGEKDAAILNSLSNLASPRIYDVYRKAGMEQDFKEVEFQRERMLTDVSGILSNVLGVTLSVLSMLMGETNLNADKILASISATVREPIKKAISVVVTSNQLENQTIGGVVRELLSQFQISEKVIPVLNNVGTVYHNFDRILLAHYPEVYIACLKTVNTPTVTIVNPQSGSYSFFNGNTLFRRSGELDNGTLLHVCDCL